MARSSLFRALRRVLRKSSPTSARESGVSRRQFIGSLGALAVVPALGACGSDDGDDVLPVAVVGGGIAGLSAAYFLALGGVRVNVFEASARIGGRMYTDRTTYTNGQLVELGGELVDSNHVVVPALCEAFGLTLDDLVEDTQGLKQDIFHFNGNELDDNQIVTDFTPVAEKMQMALAATESETDPASIAEFERIDAMSIPQYLENDCGLAANSTIRQLLELAYTEEYGLDASQQSAWNLIYLIDSETPDPFRVFGDSDERFHIHEGNDALPTQLGEELADRVKLGHRLSKVTKDGDTFVLTFGVEDGDVEVRAQHVVYALPFTKLREVDLEGAELSEEKREVIDELGYGTNAKLMMQFSDRHWETAHNSGGGVITDVGELQTIWATSRGQDGVQGILTNFVGAARGLSIGEGTAESQAATVLPWIDTIFPGTAAKYVAGSAIRQHWPSYEYAKGSYGCYTVGQWRFFGTEGAREGNQHFCGEHCSEDFQGYMEGGAETGTMVAAEVLDDLGLEQPAMLKTLLDMVVAERPRASYHAGFGKRMRVSQIRKRGTLVRRRAVGG
ncbi:MAG: FAD-dependent oxidoreductase [Kofleriaceae bacterium]|nr:FAD-dependent oxidoreductase [Kofleriaceae bacterium]